MKLLKQLYLKYSLGNIRHMLIPGIVFTLLLYPSILGMSVLDSGVRYSLNMMELMQEGDFTPVRITTGTLTISGGGIPLPPKPPFPPVNIKTERLTISGGGTPLPPKPPFPGVTIRTSTLTISGKPK